MREYAAMNNVVAGEAHVIFKDDTDACWHFYCEAPDVSTAISIADALNQQERRTQ